MKKFLLIVALIGSYHSNAQDYLIGPTIAYQNQSGNFLKIGAYYLQPINNNRVGFKIEANAQMAYFRDKFLAIPEGSLSFYPTFEGVVVPFAEAELTPYTLTPKIGLSVATFVEIAIGYGFDTKTKNELKPIKGFTFSLGFNIPLNAKLNY